MYDGIVYSGIATVGIQVTNQAPVAQPNSYTLQHDATLALAPSGVLTDDTDADFDTLSAVLESNVLYGVLTLQSNGSFIYAPNPRWLGTDSFTYRASDGVASSSPVTVTLQVVNETAVANDDNYSISHDRTLTGNVLTNDTDSQDPLRSVVLASNVENGSLTLNPTGSFTYVLTLRLSDSERAVSSRII